MPGFLPRAIRVERKNGQWSASSIILSLLEPCNDQPISIPSRIVAMPIAKASPPVTHQPAAKNITPKVPSHPAKPSAPTKSFSQAASSLIIGAIISLLLTILGLVSFVYFLKFLFSRWKRQRARRLV
jgi:hypothetical protein